jgi:hypothetical protein
MDCSGLPSKTGAWGRGEQGKLGPTGSPGPQGEGLFSESLLMLPARSPAPAGYTLVGSYELKPLSSSGKSKDNNSGDIDSKDNKKMGVDVYVRN